MHTYAVDGIRLDLKVDHAPVSINVAMPVGLLVNELLTNAFKYAFNGREGGVITVRCLHDQDDRYQVVVADDGVGLLEDVTWPVQASSVRSSFSPCARMWRLISRWKVLADGECG